MKNEDIQILHKIIGYCQDVENLMGVNRGVISEKLFLLRA